MPPATTITDGVRRCTRGATKHQLIATPMERALIAADPSSAALDSSAPDNLVTLERRRRPTEDTRAGALRASGYTIYVALPDNEDEMLLVHGYTGAFDK